MSDNETPPNYEQEETPKEILVELHIRYIEIHNYAMNDTMDSGLIIKPFFKVFLIQDKWTKDIEDKEVCWWLINHNNICIMPMNIALAIKNKYSKDMSYANNTGISVIGHQWRPEDLEDIGLNHYSFEDNCIIINGLMGLYKKEEEEE